MFEIDFLPVDSASSEGSTKSGDAITGRFVGSDGRQKVFVIDAGCHATGEAVVNHIKRYYDTTNVDLALSTLADGDHINGMPVVVDELTVDELFIHQPRKHAGAEVSDFSNIDAVDTLIKTAHARGTRVSSPFIGEVRLDGHLTVLGPDRDFYEDLLGEHLREVRTGSKAMSLSQVHLDRTALARAWPRKDPSGSRRSGIALLRGESRPEPGTATRTVPRGPLGWHADNPDAPTR